MGNNGRLDSFIPPETLSQCGLGRGRPAGKREKMDKSYRRLYAQLLAQVSDGAEIYSSDTADIRSLMHNRRQRLLQLAGSSSEIAERERQWRIHMLRRSNRNKIGRNLPLLVNGQNYFREGREVRKFPRKMLINGDASTNGHAEVSPYHYVTRGGLGNGDAGQPLIPPDIADRVYEREEVEAALDRLESTELEWAS
jgi:hypothetical protein